MRFVKMHRNRIFYKSNQNQDVIFMNILSNMDEIADVIIRPSRYVYKAIDLGAKSFLLDGQTVSRTDFEIKNSRNMILKCSLFSKSKEERSNDVLIYLHCNSGSRIEGLAYLKLAIEHEFSYLVFDFSGSGMSEGKYISLGFYEAQDLQCIIKHLKENVNSKAKICLWGRSMGAATGTQKTNAALRYLSKFKNQVKVAIFDSPFQSLKQLFLEIGKQKTHLPQILLNVAYKYLKPIILEKAKFDIDEVDLENLLHHITCPGIFLASKHDTLIPFAQMDDIFMRYKAQKQMFFIQQSHNQARNSTVIKKVFKSLRKQLLMTEQNGQKKQKISYFSIIPAKEGSKKKLQLTIKSLSQRQLNTKQTLDNRLKIQIPNVQIQKHPLMERRQASCLFPINKFRNKQMRERQPKQQIKQAPESIIFNKSESFLETKRKPLLTKNFFAEDLNKSANENEAEIKFKPKFAGQAKVITVKMTRQVDGKKSRQRKTLQHISSKRPPFVQLKGAREMRNSFELRYRT